MRRSRIFLTSAQGRNQPPAGKPKAPDQSSPRIGDPQPPLWFVLCVSVPLWFKLGDWSGRRKTTESNRLEFWHLRNPVRLRSGPEPVEWLRSPSLTRHFFVSLPGFRVGKLGRRKIFDPPKIPSGPFPSPARRPRRAEEILRVGSKKSSYDLIFLPKVWWFVPDPQPRQLSRSRDLSAAFIKKQSSGHIVTRYSCGLTRADIVMTLVAVPDHLAKYPG